MEISKSSERAKYKIWICGACGNGPMKLELNPSCVECGHVLNETVCTSRGHCTVDWSEVMEQKRGKAIKQYHHTTHQTYPAPNDPPFSPSRNSGDHELQADQIGDLLALGSHSDNTINKSSFAPAKVSRKSPADLPNANTALLHSHKLDDDGHLYTIRAKRSLLPRTDFSSYISAASIATVLAYVGNGWVSKGRTSKEAHTSDALERNDEALKATFDEIAMEVSGDNRSLSIRSRAETTTNESQIKLENQHEPTSTLGTIPDTTADISALESSIVDQSKALGPQSAYTSDTASGESTTSLSDIPNEWHTIDRLVGQCLTILLTSSKFWLSSPLCDGGGGSGSGQNSNESERNIEPNTDRAGETTRTGDQTRSYKHKRADDDGGNGRPNPQKKRMRLTARDAGSQPLFACPYFKRNRRRYQRCRSCPGPGWAEVHRLKEHLYRCHKIQIHCPRCRQLFTTNDLLLEHQRSPESCVLHDTPCYEGFDIIQEQRLRSRKREQEQRTEEDKWRKMYQILFPNDDPADIPSPYYDDCTTVNAANDSTSSSTGSDFSQYEAFLQQELPLLVRQELERGFDEAADGGLDNIRLHLPDIFRDVQVRLLRIYMRRQNGAASVSTGTLSSGTRDFNPEIPNASHEVPFETVVGPIQGLDLETWNFESVCDFDDSFLHVLSADP